MQFKQLLAASVLSSAASAQSLTAVLANNTQLSSLAGLLATYPDLVTSLSSSQNNLTLLAPSNAALSAFTNSTNLTALPAGAVQAVLQYHVLNGSIPASAFTNTSTALTSLLTNTTYTNVTAGQAVIARLNGTNATLFSGLDNPSVVTQANITFDRGLIHIIDRVLTLPPALGSALISANLTALYGALNTTNLLTTVAGLRDVTIFAPNNAAFQAIGSATTNLTVQQASTILTYHVVNGTRPIYSNLITGNTTLQTLNGGSLNVRVSGANVFVNSARVVRTNFLVGGGVVHIIDAVLNPANATATADPTATTGAPAFSGASSATNVPYTSGVSTPASTLGAGSGNPTSTSSAGAMPKVTGAIGAAALFGAGAWALGNM